MNQKVLWVSVGLCLTLCWASHSLALEQIPEPTGLVNDGAGILKSPQVLEKRLMQLEKETGAEMTLVTRKTLPKGESLEAYSTRLFNAWGVGKRSQNNGLLLLLALQERKMRLEVGKGLTSKIPAAQAQAILDQEVRPALKQGDFDGGMKAAIAQVEQRLKPPSLQALETNVANDAEKSASDTYWLLAAVGVGGIFILVMLGLLLRGIFAILRGASSRSTGNRSALRHSSHRRAGVADPLNDNLTQQMTPSGFTATEDDSWRSSFSSDSGSSSFESFGGGSSDGGGASSDW